MTCTLYVQVIFCAFPQQSDIMEKLQMKTDKITFTNSNIGLGLKTATKIVSIQEGGAGLSNIRFIQDTATGLIPKAVFARSMADLSENSFLELSESVLVYYCPALLGKIFKNIYAKNLSPDMKNFITTPAAELLKKGGKYKPLMPLKAAIALGAFAIPLIEFTLNYIKNLMTLKVFKQGNFENIANLNKDKNIDKNIDKNFNAKVEKSAKKNILSAAGIYAGTGNHDEGKQDKETRSEARIKGFFLSLVNYTIKCNR